MNLNDINKIDQAGQGSQAELFRLGLSVLFLVMIVIFLNASGRGADGGSMLIIAAVIGGYMAMNIGANDVANNVGPAVGSKAMTMVGAIAIAAIFEAGGALIAGGDVVSTIKKGIINPEMIANADVFVWLMMAALLAGAVWLNLATAVGAPVSTTHSIVGGVLGAGIAAGGFGIANWDKMGAIAASWVISPVIGGLIAALFLYIIKHTITYQSSNMLNAAKKIVPILVAVMCWAFGTYIMLKGVKHIWKVDFVTACGIGLGFAVIAYFLLIPTVKRMASRLENSKESVNSLFTVPLIFAAALLSFAHGANDVANAVGPLAAINDALLHHGVAKKAAIPLWVMMVGALGIAIGLALYGPKLIRTVGSEITELDKMRAFCIAMAAAITVIIASQLGLPVSSTHIAVGGVFGVGFLREALKVKYARIMHDIREHHKDDDPEEVERFLSDFEQANVMQKREMLEQLKARKSGTAHLTKKERKQLNKLYQKELVKRSALMKIAAAWLITVPASGALAALFFYMIKGMNS